MTRKLRVGLGQFNELTDEKLAFIKQCGADDFLMNTPKLPGDKQWEYEDLLALRRRADAAQLRLMALENVPVSFYDKAMLGLPGRDEQIAHMQTTIRNMGRAGIPILGYHWMPNSVWRTPEMAVLRGGARGTRFNLAEHDPNQLTHGRIYTEDEMWANYEYYLARILPVAEESNVQLALHPDDPPVPALGGIARIFRNFDGFKRAMDTFDSSYHGLDFCMGCWSEMGGMENVIRAVRHFGARDKIIYVHFTTSGHSRQFQRVLHQRRQRQPVRSGQDTARRGFYRFHDHRPRAPHGGRHRLGASRPRLRHRLYCCVDRGGGDAGVVRNASTQNTVSEEKRRGQSTLLALSMKTEAQDLLSTGCV
ncbi:MAG: mannonate dehydratase [Caldilineaceae bacterium]